MADFFWSNVIFSIESYLRLLRYLVVYKCKNIVKYIISKLNQFDH